VTANMPPRQEQTPRKQVIATRLMARFRKNVEIDSESRSALDMWSNNTARS
jgi:hypothetical protein